MNRFLAILCFVLCASVTSRADAQTPVSFGFFYNSLDPYGQWVQVGDYGYCWHPNNVGPDWRPYADGYWAYTDDGWTWVSYEDFGWITYHYGRWLHVQDFGWCWAPDYQWAPAWVSWRCGDQYVGWAPLPPEARFQVDAGFGAGCDAEYDIGPSCYNFCEIGSFGSPALLSVLIDPSRNVALIDNSANVTNVSYRNNAIVDGGPDYRVLSGRSARPIQSLQLVRRTDPGIAGNAAFARQIGGQLVVIAPNVAPSSAGMRPARIAQVLPQERVDKGWNGISDPNLKARLRAKFSQESVSARPGAVSGSVPAENSTPRRAQQPFTETAPAPNREVLQPFVQPSPAVRGAVIDEHAVQSDREQKERTEPARNQAVREQEFGEKRPAPGSVQPPSKEGYSKSEAGKETEKSTQQQQQQQQ